MAQGLLENRGCFKKWREKMFRKLGWLSVFSFLGCLWLTSVSFGGDENTGNPLPAHCKKSGQEVNSLSNDQIYECLQWLHNRYGEFYSKYNERVYFTGGNHINGAQGTAITEPQTIVGTEPQTIVATEPQTRGSNVMGTEPQTIVATEPQTIGATEPQTHSMPTEPQTRFGKIKSFFGQ